MKVTLAHLHKFEFPPFQQAIDAGVDAIMLAHARVPALDPDPEKITTISTKVVTKTLKDELGFKGVIVTDALEMKGLIKLLIHGKAARRPLHPWMPSKQDAM